MKLSDDEKKRLMRLSKERLGQLGNELKQIEEDAEIQAKEIAAHRAFIAMEIALREADEIQ